jgi:hypothetical protein
MAEASCNPTTPFLPGNAIGRSGHRNRGAAYSLAHCRARFDLLVATVYLDANSLIRSAQLSGHDPYVYLKDVLPDR